MIETREVGPAQRDVYTHDGYAGYCRRLTDGTWVARTADHRGLGFFPGDTLADAVARLTGMRPGGRL